MSLVPSEYIEVKRVKGKGRGVFARKLIPKNTIFERAPLLVLKEGEALGEDCHVLPYYVFEYGKGTIALALGFGSLYNHSFRPNARYEDVGNQTKHYIAIRDIKPGEEVTINYNGDEASKIPVGFDVLD
jgi:SET domain-containing protein